MVGVTAAILAGGLGTRLRSVVADRPKVLAEIRGLPFLAYLLSQLSDNGVRTVVLCTGYLGENIWNRFGDSYGTVKLVYSREPSPLGTAGALRLALPLLESASVLVMNGDSFYDTDLDVFWEWHRRRGGEATLALTYSSDSRRYGQVRVDAGGVVLSFDEKGASGGSGWINAGVYLLKRSFIEDIPETGAVSLENEIFPRWIGKGLYGYRAGGRFLDIGTPDTYAEAERFFVPATVR